MTIKCKYKCPNNERFCRIIHGECQFLNCEYGPLCPIYHEYIDWEIDDFTYLIGEFDEGIFIDEVNNLQLIREEDEYED